MIKSEKLREFVSAESSVSISTLDMLASSSFGVVQCYNNYKAVYGAETKITTTDIAVPYIADTITLWNLKGYLNFEVSDTTNLMTSIKNAMSVAATTYAAHCISSMAMEVVPEEVKEEYIEPIFNQVMQFNDVVYDIMYNSCEQIIGLITDLFQNNNE